ncbi:MAG TPA: hypothetical protein VFE62_08355 [Gemmataceae bacterium]|nr:hypothetical protein [Gemmataceae bacterium]
MPAGWIASGLAGFRGLARFTRRFGYPGRIDDGEHVWLVGDTVRGLHEIKLNDEILSNAAASTSFSFDVTGLLAQRNRLEILLQGDSDDAGLWGEIALEIRRDAYLAEVAVVRDGQMLVITGRVAGTSPGPLELYTLIDNRNADYRVVNAGESFRVELADVPENSQSVRVELICVSSIWYVVEAAIPTW